MITIICASEQLAKKAREITDDIERRLDSPAFSGREFKIEIGDYNCIEGADDIGYDVATLYRAIFDDENGD